jgi:hypothetical protein
MKNLKSVLVNTAIAVTVILSGCASLEGPSDPPDILASMHDSSQTGGE